MTWDDRRSAGSVRRGLAGPVIVLAGVLAVIGLGTAYLLRSEDPGRAAGPVPEPIAPFGSVSREDLEFRWAVPHDGAPVRVEVLSKDLEVLWRSGPTSSGRLAPREAERAALPSGDLWWRGVAMPEREPERPGDLAAFTVVR